MRMNAERQNQENIDVYSDLSTPYSATYFAPEAQEFSLQEVQEKLGKFSDVEDPVLNGNAGTDAMPSQQTLKMSYQREYKSNVEKEKKVSTKTKVAAISYVAVVLLLVLGIALTSVSVSGVFAETSALTATYTDLATQISALEEQLSVEDYTVLEQRAAELGYVNASQDNANTATYTEIQTRPAQNFNIETNWFDQFCDWVCGVFGG